MPDEIKVLTRTSEIDPRRQPPDTELLRQVKDRFTGNANKKTNQLLRAPDSILQPMNRVQKYLQKLPFAPNKAIWHFINYLVQYGALIMTDDPTRRYFFDTEQLDELIRAGRYREVPVLKSEPKTRLAAFLSNVHQTARRVLSAAETKALFVSDMFELLKGLCEEHPEIENVIYALGQTVADSHSADAAKTQNLSATLALTLEQSLRQIVTRVESQSLELVAAMTPSAPVSVGQTREELSTKNLPGAETRLIALTGDIAKLQAQLDRLRREQNLIEHYLSDVKQRVLEEELIPRLNFAEAENMKRVELAIERAHAKADELNEYIGKLLTMQAPIDNRLRELQRLQSALKICATGQNQTPPVLSESVMPARPTYDADELLDWQSVDLSEEMATTILTDLSSFTPDEKLIIAAFQILGRKTSTGKMARALVALGLAGKTPERELRLSCRSLSEQEPPSIRYVGCVARCSIYMHSGSVVIGNVKTIIPEKKQAELLAMFQKPTPEPEPDD